MDMEKRERLQTHFQYWSFDVQKSRITCTLNFSVLLFDFETHPPSIRLNSFIHYEEHANAPNSHPLISKKL